MPISNEENRRFEELVGTLEKQKLEETKVKTDARPKKLVAYSLVGLAGLVLIVTAVVIAQPLVGVAAFGIMVYAGNQIINLFY